MLVLVVLSTFVPGILASLSLFRKDQNLILIEKVLLGCALGMISLPMIPFLMYFVLGIKFSYTIALLSVGILYVISLALTYRSGLYEDLLNLLKFDWGAYLKSLNFDFIKREKIVFLLLLLLVVSYLIRSSNYSPVFQELDPYYYTYVAHQILTLGENPINDHTAWGPSNIVSHREIPEIGYLESVWYRLYFGATQYDNFDLALVASTYPPLAALFMIFFVYLLVSTFSGREMGLLSAGLAAFIPIIVLKLSAGEIEAQPWAFFTLFFTYATFVISIKYKNLMFGIISGLSLAALCLGSGVEGLAFTSIGLFGVIESLFIFFTSKDRKNDLKFHLLLLVIIFILGIFVGKALLKNGFGGNPISGIGAGYLVLMAVFSSLFFYLLDMYVSNSNVQKYVLGSVAVLAVLAFLFTPVGSFIKKSGADQFAIAQYNYPLDRTIAEQGESSGDFGGTLGFFSDTYDGVASTFMMPLQVLLNGNSIVSTITSILSGIFNYGFYLFSFISNKLLVVLYTFLNSVLGVDIHFTEKTNSFLLFWFFLFLVSVVYSFYRLLTSKVDNLFLFFLMLIILPFLVGIVKEKYAIYMGAMMAVSIGFSLGTLMSLFSDFIKDLAFTNVLKKVVIYIGLVLVLMQFLYQGQGPGLLWGSFQPLYQNNPTALSSKLTDVCHLTNDAEVCAAAKDPLGYASSDIERQYNQKLCAVSIFSTVDYLTGRKQAPFWESMAFQYRCNRLTTYWLESMNWIKENTASDAIITSWWDYGHWINYFGQRNAVIRNDHKDRDMIGDIAHAYVDATSSEFKTTMTNYNSKYAIFDVELIGTGVYLGNKYGALNYLSCANDNGTTVANAPGDSQCELDHLWETVVISPEPCTVSELSNKTGIKAYKIYVNAPNGRKYYVPYYPSECLSQNGQPAQCSPAVVPEPVYCVAPTTLADGSTITATYYLNETYPNGDLKLNKALLQATDVVKGSYHFGDIRVVTLYYTKDPIWLENGEVKSGYEDRKGKFYDSALYQAYFLGQLPGFTLVYKTPDNAVKIFKMND